LLRIIARLRAAVDARELRAFLLGVAAYLAAGPLVAVFHEALVLAAASGLAVGSELAAARLLPLLPVDPVYGGAGLHILGGIKAHGLAVVGPLGAGLHGLLPGLFSPPSLVPSGAFASAVLESGSTVLARMLASLFTTVLLLVAAIGLTRWSMAPPWLRVAAALFQVHILLEHVLEEGLNIRELEATGLPFALAALGPVGESGQRELFTRQLDGVSETVVSSAGGLILALVAYVLALGVVSAVLLIRRKHPTLCLRSFNVSWATLSRAAAITAVGVALVATPLGVLADGEVSVIAVPTPDLEGAAVVVAGVEPSNEADALLDVVEPEPTPRSALAPRSALVPTTSASPTPNRRGSVVALEGGNYRYRYLVDGEPTVIRGMGYNPWYSKLDPAERRRRYDRDFALMRKIGVNTIEGWFQTEFDEVTLDAAHAHGIGVVMPFELNQDYDYTDPAVREKFANEVAAWVVRYRDHPAVRMWGPGNEMMHRLIYPTIVQGAPDPVREARADAFAAFYVELIDMIRVLDPNHPIVYRDAEDLYFSRLRTALLRDGTSRPWFIYGANAYTARLQEVIDNWPQQGVDAPLLVSEFSPGGVSPSERPGKLGWFWSVIRSRPDMVLGGVVYTWATEGPEDLDRIFGLTDPEGTPVDGSVAALGRIFRGGAEVARDPS
jgi:hypothetical protein